VVLTIVVPYALFGRDAPKAALAQGAPAAASGEALYAANCAACHGDTGRGDGPAAFLLYPKPRNFHAADFRLVSGRNGVPTDEDLLAVINQGMPGSTMPPWLHLPVEDRKALVAHVRRLAREGFAQALRAADPNTTAEEAAAIALDRTTPGEVLVPPAEPPLTPESLAHGRNVYLVGCASCHGPTGRGDGIEVAKDSTGVPVRPRDLTQGIFKGRSAGPDLFRRVRLGMPGSAMPSFSTFSDQEVWDVVHYVAALGSPALAELHRPKRLTITARRISEPVPRDARSPVWERIAPVHVTLTPLSWREDRPDGVLVRAVHDGRELGLRLEWVDRTKNAGVLRVQTFRDGAAVQLATGASEPIFAMGAPAGAVEIWHWKADWQEDAEHGVADVESAWPGMVADVYPFDRGGPGFAGGDDATFLGARHVGNPLAQEKRPGPMERLSAQGVGTLGPYQGAILPIGGSGNWDNQLWRVAFVRALDPGEPGRAKLAPGERRAVAFAVWDGAAGDRNGQKSVTIWQDLVLEP
jgi:mono/diheme cytochrome c family protein